MRESLAGTGLSRLGRESAPRFSPYPALRTSPMDSISSSSAAVAAASAGARSTAESNIATPLVAAAKLLLAELERGRAIDAQTLRTAMTAGFARSDAEGAWDWKTGYDAAKQRKCCFCAGSVPPCVLAPARLRRCFRC